jgi:hypothetical protein
MDVLGAEMRIEDGISVIEPIAKLILASDL